MKFKNSMKSADLAKRVRKLSLKMVCEARASHIGSALSIADIISVLYSEILNFDASYPNMPSRDRFILSKGHACVALYAALAEQGFFSISELETYGQDHSNFMNHVSHKVPGVEFSTGALGHGLSFGVGKAFAAKCCKENWRTFVLLSDGELDEGSNWEAFMFAAHHKLDNLVAIIDYNKLQSLTTVKNTLGLEPLAEKLSAFGWAVKEVQGHSHEELSSALGAIAWETDKPSVLIAHTIKGKGVSFMENRVEWHYRSPTIDQLKCALEEVESGNA